MACSCGNRVEGCARCRTAQDDAELAAFRWALQRAQHEGLKPGQKGHAEMLQRIMDQQKRNQSGQHREPDIEDVERQLVAALMERNKPEGEPLAVLAIRVPVGFGVAQEAMRNLMEKRKVMNVGEIIPRYRVRDE